MKYTKMLILIFLSIMSTHAQIITPSASPSITLSQKVGITDITLKYSRPSVKGREIFSKSGLVPFGEYWRLGANSPTIIETSDDMKVGGVILAKGTYVLLAKPGTKEWEFSFYTKDKGGWNKYIDRVPVLTVSASSISTDYKMESFLIYIDQLNTTSADMVIHWDKTIVKIPMEVEVHDKVMASIEKTMNGPSDFDYFNAASYLHSVDQDLEKALKYIQVAAKGDNPTFFFSRREATILAKLGRFQEAIQSALQSNELARKVGNVDVIKLNEASVKEWTAKMK